RGDREEIRRRLSRMRTACLPLSGQRETITQPIQELRPMNRVRVVWGVLLIVVVIAGRYAASQQAAEGTARLAGARPAIEAINYVSLQAAIDALPATGGVVRLPAGVFEINEPLKIS